MTDVDLKQYHKWRWRLLSGWIVIFTAATALALYGNKQRADDIQRSRVDLTRIGCTDQNLRNQQTKQTMNNIIKTRSADATPAQKVQLQQSRIFTFLIVDAVIPVRDCEAYVKHVANATK